MTTYKTIEEAFVNGTGDVFFINDNGEFVARSRHIENLIDRMKSEGFTFYSLPDLKRPTAQTPPAVQIAKTVNPVKSYSTSSNGHDGYYDEFPDAYGQSL